MKKLLGAIIALSSLSAHGIAIGDTMSESQLNTYTQTKTSNINAKVLVSKNSDYTMSLTLNSSNKVTGIDYNGHQMINYKEYLGKYYPDFLTSTKTRVNKFNHNSLNIVTPNLVVISSGVGGKVFQSKIILIKESE
jgi:hypothetical protein